ncbi:MAG: polyprenyl synthetase family protein [Verrucomicrobiales bacterium]
MRPVHSAGMLVTARISNISPSPGMLSAKETLSWKEIVEPIRPFLEKVSLGLTEQVEAFDPEITGYAQYALTNQGKQIRPALVALSGAAVGQVNEGLLKVAIIIEMVHLATLVHDDIMDEAEVRRCRPTMAANWGQEISVLVGDCLFAHALMLAASFPTPEVCRAVATATNQVCSGEIIQTHQRRKFNLSREEYFRALAMKTGELFALSCEMGGALTGATPVMRKALRDYGLALGTAYQIYDDCLDLFGSEAIVGKSLGTDLASGKLTLPMLIVLEKGSDSEKELVQNLLGNWEEKYFPQIIELLAKHDALNLTREVIFQFINQAGERLGDLKKSANITALEALGDFLAQQTSALGVQ